MMYVKKADASDFSRIIEIYRYAQDYMIQSGNPDQWGHFYPDPELVRNDIEEGVCRVICRDGIHGVFAMVEGPDPTYEFIEGGAWLNDDPYIVIHRIAGDGQAHGIFQCAADYCKSVSSNVNAPDTTSAAYSPRECPATQSGFKSSCDNATATS